MTAPSSAGWCLSRFSNRLDWLLCYLFSTLVILGSIAFGRVYVVPAPGHDTSTESFLNCFFHWDGNYYREIAVSGYGYDAGRQSTVHFFPLYPLIGHCVTASTGLSPDVALVLIAHLALASALYLLARYIDRRYGSDQPVLRLSILLAVVFVPANMFFRMAYSESLFLLLCISTLYLLERHASPLCVAVVIGLATAARPVGVALLPPLFLYLVRYYRNRWAMLGAVCFYPPLSCAGLLAFMLYCRETFGDPIAFAHNMRLWFMQPSPPFGEKLLILGTLEPVWSIFTPGMPSFWGNHTTADRVFFTLYVVNPLYFVGTAVLLFAGMWRRWLNAYESLAAWGLLLIPYWSAGYECQMTGMARYCTVVVPVYLVMGRLLHRLPSPFTLGLLALSTVLLGIDAALFARWYWFV